MRGSQIDLRSPRTWRGRSNPCRAESVRPPGGLSRSETLFLKWTPLRDCDKPDRKRGVPSRPRLGTDHTIRVWVVEAVPDLTWRRSPASVESRELARSERAPATVRRNTAGPQRRYRVRLGVGLRFGFGPLRLYIPLSARVAPRCGRIPDVQSSIGRSSRGPMQERAHCAHDAPVDTLRLRWLLPRRSRLRLDFAKHRPSSST